MAKSPLPNIPSVPPGMAAPLPLLEGDGQPQQESAAGSQLGLCPGLVYERFGLVENPFGVTPNPRYMYQSGTHREALASLIVGIEYGVGFQALIAAPGMGKTTILLSLLGRLRGVALTGFLSQNHGDSCDLLRQLVVELGGEAKDSDLISLQDRVNQMIVRELEAGRQTIIIIDEAQSLDACALETVRLLSNFETPDEKLLQIILAGQPQLAQRLASPDASQLYQRVPIRTPLLPFGLEDTRSYIEHRLRIAGYSGPPLFTPGAVKSIWERSCGVPREINTLCFNALLLATAANRKGIDSSMLCEVAEGLDLKSIPFNGDCRSNGNLGKQTTSGSRPETNPPTKSCDQSREAVAPFSPAESDVADICSIFSERPDSHFIPISENDPPDRKTEVVDSTDQIRTTLLPLDLEGARNYIEHRLKTSGYREQPLFCSEASTQTSSCHHSSEAVATGWVAKTDAGPLAAPGRQDCTPKPVANVGGGKTGVVNSVDGSRSSTHVPEVPRGTMYRPRAWAREVLSVSKGKGHILAIATIVVLCLLLLVMCMWVQQNPRLSSAFRAAVHHEPSMRKTAEDVLGATLPLAGNKLATNQSNLANVGNNVASATSVVGSSGDIIQATRDDDSAGPNPNLTLAQLIRTVKPTYPPAALDARIEGSVVLEVLVDANGTARHIHVISGPSVLVPSAIDAVEHWMFRPSYLNGEPIESQVLVGVKFSLH